MSGRIQIVVDGKPEFIRTFDRLDAIFDDFTPIWPDIRDKFWQIEKEQFDTEGAAGGERWQQLSARYAVEKVARYGPGKKILEATGALKASLTGNADGSYYAASKDGMAVGTSLAYGMYHHRGGGKLPKRELIKFSETQKVELGKVMHKSLIRELRRGKYYVPAFER